MIGEKPKWLTFEEAVAGIQGMLTPTAKVVHNEKLVDRKGHPRQFDVVIRDRYGATPLLGVIECRDKNRRIGTDELDAFQKKREEVAANFAIIVSRRGFSKRALESAKVYGVGTLSLLPNDKDDVGFKIGFYSYATIFEWRRMKLVVYTEPPYGERNFAANEMLFDDQPVLDWCRMRLARDAIWSKSEKSVVLLVSFDRPVPVTIHGNVVNLRAMKAFFQRTKNVKTKLVSWTGEAFYDWQLGKIIIPNKATLVSSSIDIHLEDWSEFEGEIPSRRGMEGIFFDLIRIGLPIDPASIVPNLDEFGVVAEFREHEFEDEGRTDAIS